LIVGGVAGMAAATNGVVQDGHAAKP